VIVLATIGIIVFGEMSGRIAAMSRQPMFVVIRKQLGFTLGGITLIGGPGQHSGHLRRRDRRHGDRSTAPVRGQLPALRRCRHGSPGGIDLAPALQVDRTLLWPAWPVDAGLSLQPSSRSIRHGAGSPAGWCLQCLRTCVLATSLPMAISLSR